MLIRSLHILLFLLLFIKIVGQNDYRIGILPNINFNTKLNSDLKLNFKVESRQQFYEEDLTLKIKNNYNYILTDYSLVLAKQTGLNNSIAAGYLLRFRNNQIHHRFIQQYFVINKYDKLRLAHRFCLDETLMPNSFIFRARYRVTTEIALNGYSIDKNEFYLKINNEYLNEIENEEYNIEIRLVPLIGLKISENNKIESGLDYRLSSFLKSLPSQRVWLVLGWHISL